MHDWKEEKGYLVQNFECTDYRSAIDLINQVAVLSEEKDHHPDLLLYDYKFVSVMLRTHSEDAITTKDYEMAAWIDAIIEDAL